MTMLQPMFIDRRHEKGWDAEKTEILKNCGVQIIFVDEPESFKTSVVSPINSGMSGDVIVRAMARALLDNRSAATDFAENLLKEIAEEMENNHEPT